MSDQEAIHRALGRIEGAISGMQKTQEIHGQKLEMIDARVTSNEVKASGAGAVAGGLMAAFTMIVKTTIWPGH